MSNRVRKPIADLIGELRSWLPNFDHGPNDYPTLLWRILASAPGGDEAENVGYEPFNLGWHEIDQLGRVLVAIQDKRDVEDLVAGLFRDEVDERRHPARRTQESSERTDRPISMTYGTLPPFARFVRDIRRPDPDHVGQSYWPEGTLYPMELANDEEIELAEQFGGLQPFASRYSHKSGFRGDERAIYGFLEYLVSAWNDGNEAGGDLASSILTTLGYEWI
jgi:hypothetical protein